MVDGTSDVTTWLQVGTLVGAVVGGAGLVLRGRWGEATPAVSQTRAEATEVYSRDMQLNRELLQSMLATMVNVKEMAGRIVIAQEEMVRLMREQQEDARFVERTKHMMEQIGVLGVHNRKNEV